VLGYLGASSFIRLGFIVHFGTTEDTENTEGLGLLKPLPKQRSAGPSPFGCSNVNPPSSQRRAKALRYEKTPRHFRRQHLFTSNQKSKIINHQSSIINHQSSIINHQSSIINHQSSIINHQSSIINQLS
jgi:hypothetical protein